MNNSIKNLEKSGVSIVIGSFNRKRFLKKTIETVRAELDSGLFPSEIIIIDGGSTDGTVSWLIKQKDIITIVQHNRGNWKGQLIEQRSWGYFMNLGFKSAKGKYICMISDDCLVVPKAIINGYNLFESKLQNNEKVGGIAFLFRDWPDMEKYYYQTHWGIININHGMYLKEALEIVNYADEETYQFYNADVDIVYKLLLQNYSVIVSENSFIEHFFHANANIRKKNNQIAYDDDYQFIKKWSPICNQIQLKPFKDMVFNEVSFHHKFNTIKYWQNMADYKIFIVRRYATQHMPPIISKILNKIITLLKRK